MIHRPSSERGAVTAELAIGLPMLVAVTIGLVWLLSVGAAQIRTVDAARETARAVARGDDVAAAVARGRRVAPDGAEVAVTRTGGQVVATSSAEVDGPGGLFGFLPAVRCGPRRSPPTRSPSEPSTAGEGRGHRPGGRVPRAAAVRGAALGVVGAMVKAHRVAQAAADLSALAGASALADGKDACAAAARVATANGASVTDCAPDGLEVRVTVEVDGPRWLGQTADLVAEARAGPA